MAPNPRLLDKRLDALYAELPRIECQGLCSDSCGPIEMSVRERQRIEREHGEVTCGSVGASCSMLDENRRCLAYAKRPIICRLWGLTARMRCHYGCQPERWLSDAEAFDFIARADTIGGSPTDRNGRLEQQLRVQAEALGAAYEKHVSEVARKVVPVPTLGDRRRLISPPGIHYNRTGVKP